MDHDVLMCASFLLQGLASKTGGFGTEGDRVKAVEAAEHVVKLSIAATGRIEKYRDELRAKELSELSGHKVPARPPPTSVPGGSAQGGD